MTQLYEMKYLSMEFMKQIYRLIYFQTIRFMWDGMKWGALHYTGLTENIAWRQAIQNLQNNTKACEKRPIQILYWSTVEQ